jgi:hypothetical protein
MKLCVFRKMDETGDHDVEQSNPNSKSQISNAESRSKIIKIIIKMGLACKRYTAGGFSGRGKRHRVLMGEEDQIMLLIYVWRQHNKTHQILFLKGREEESWLRECNRGGKLVKNTLYAYMEFSHRTLLYH